MEQQSPEAIIAGYQQLLGAAHYRCAMAENAAQQLAAQLNQANAEIERLKEQPMPTRRSRPQT
jgi:hypothetical protein